MGEWISNHKFWASVIILLVVVYALGMTGIIADALNWGKILGWYIFIGGILWVVDRREGKKKAKDASKQPGGRGKK